MEYKYEQLHKELLERMERYLESYPCSNIALAKMIGVSRQTFGNYLRGKNVKLLTLRVIKKFLIDQGF